MEGNVDKSTTTVRTSDSSLSVAEVTGIQRSSNDAEDGIISHSLTHSSEKPQNKTDKTSS